MQRNGHSLHLYNRILKICNVVFKHKVVIRNAGTSLRLHNIHLKLIGWI